MPFTGKATYDNFAMIGEDISDIMMLLSPINTPLLEMLVQPANPAVSTLHQWSEEALGPDRIIASAAINSATAATGIMTNGFGLQLQVGMLLELDVPSGNQEILQISSIPGANSLLCARNFGARGINSLVAGGTLTVISTAELEGSETSGDVTRPRTRRSNYTQIFKKPITISGTDQSVITGPPVGSEFDHQTTLRAAEALRDLEKAIFRSVASGSSIGSSSAYRTMDGLRQYLTSINSTIASNSFAANPVDYINDLMQQAWNSGARDLNVLVAGAQWKREISASNNARLNVTQGETGIVRVVETIQTDFGILTVQLSPWLPDRYLMGIATSRVKAVPLQGRSFQKEILAKTGDSMKGHIIGEYTLEVHHPDKMFQARTAG